MTHACACVGYKLYLRERNFSLLGYIFLQYWHTRLNGNQYTGPLHPTIERRRDSRAERGLEAGDVEQLIKQQRNSFQTQQQPRTVLRIDRWPLQYGTATNLDNKKNPAGPAIRPVFTASTRGPYHATRRRRRTQYRVQSPMVYCIRAVSCFLRASPG